jgi:hypothetical protein
MMLPQLTIGAGVDVEHLQPVMQVVLHQAPLSFYKYGHDCYLTSAYRKDDDDSFHGVGRGCDFDSSRAVDRHIGDAIADDLGEHLGRDFTCLWHKTSRGNWHLHVEADPDRQGLAAYRARAA